MKAYRISIVLVLVCALLAAGCSGGYDNYAMKNSGAANYAMEMEYEMYDADESAAYAYLAPGELTKLSAEANLPAERKIIRDAQVTMEAEEVEPSYEKVLALLSGMGGYEAERNMRNNSYGIPTVNSTLKIPAAKLDAFLAEVKEIGEVIASNISSSDISDQYFDAKIRLDTLEKTLENYRRFLENAESVEEQLEVTRYINETTYEIERLKGSLRRWDSLVDYSTVGFQLYPINAAPEEPRVIEWDSLSLEDMGWFISSGFLSVCNAIFSVLQWLVISLVAISPILLILALLVFLLIRRHKKWKMKQQLLPRQQPQNPGNNNNA